MLDGWRPATAWLGQAATIAGQYPGIGDEGGENTGQRGELLPRGLARSLRQLIRGCLAPARRRGHFARTRFGHAPRAGHPSYMFSMPLERYVCLNPL